MIKIDFKAPETDSWRGWRIKCQNETADIIDCYETSGLRNVTNLYKEKAIKEEVFLAKEGPFHGKCAYCECYLKGYQHGDIEHFRPKLAVTDENDNIINITDSNGKTSPHPGYYWLAYDWSNLLPSCVDCNQPKTTNGEKLGKRNRFPVEKEYASRPSEELNEKPILINPTSEDPSAHLVVDEKTGIMLYKTDRGKMCVKIFGLNIRDFLIEDRLKAIAEVTTTLDKILHNPDEGERLKALQKLKKIKEGKFAFSAAAHAFLANISPFILQIFGIQAET